MVSKLTYLFSFVAASATVYYLVAMTENIGPLLPAAGQILFVVGPYAALGILAWVIRWHPLAALILFGFTLVLSCFGVYEHWVAYDHFLHRDTTIPRGSNWTSFLVAVAQWFVSFCLAVIILPVLFYQKKKRLHN